MLWESVSAKHRHLALLSAQADLAVVVALGLVAAMWIASVLDNSFAGKVTLQVLVDFAAVSVVTVAVIGAVVAVAVGRCWLLFVADCDLRENSSPSQNLGHSKHS